MNQNHVPTSLLRSPKSNCCVASVLFLSHFARCIPAVAAPVGYDLRAAARLFHLGEELFKGLQVYDVIQDGRDNYLFSTNEGLFLPFPAIFEPIGCDLAKSNAMFNFVADPSGTIDCSNLNHQIFRIRDKECSLFYTLLPEEDSPDLSLICDEEGELLACSRKIIRLSAAGEVLERRETTGDPWSRPLKTHIGQIILHYPSTDSILVFHKGRFVVHRLAGLPDEQAESPVFNFFAVEDELYAVNLMRNTVWRVQDSSFAMQLLPEKYMLDRSQPLRCYATGKTTWIGGSLPGIVWLKELGRVPPVLHYGKYFISDVFQDREGNILLSTFDQGILVIPNPLDCTVIDPFATEPITALHIARSNGRLYLGTTRGNLLEFQDGQLRQLVQDGNRPVEGIFGTPTSERLIFQGGDEIMVLDPKAGKMSLGIKSALKDVVFVEPDLAFLATSRGIFRCEWKVGSTAHGDVVARIRLPHAPYGRGQTGNALVASTSRGLYHIPLNGPSNAFSSLAKTSFRRRCMLLETRYSLRAGRTAFSFWKKIALLPALFLKSGEWRPSANW